MGTATKRRLPVRRLCSRCWKPRDSGRRWWMPVAAGWLDPSGLRRRIFVMLGPALTVLAMGLMGLAPTYASLLALLLIAGTGTASFHPQGASTAGEASGDRRGTGLSLFVAGGELGYSLGPLIVALVVAIRGLEATWLVALPGLGACLLLWRSIPIRRDPPRRPEGHTLTSHLP